ncbi:iron ABC transporter permease [Agrobacterium bohemicum]|uniref:Iron ABC transporter permease n=2 Tax=Agrobacterium bohemicum TaxID=2052828 RepID=A0A135P7R9_9HYPH|nr:iron ABC transporter permease [Agrobacterium bohemicum]
MINAERWAMWQTTSVCSVVLIALSVASTLIGVSDSGTIELFMVSRLPRTLAAILVGAGLALAGLVMQTLARNSYVEPSTTGTSQSAELGVLLVTLLWPSASLLLKSVVATATALAGTALFLLTAHRLPPTQPFLVPLFGIVYGGVIGAAVTFVAWQADLLQYLAIWTNGEFSGVLRGRYELLWISGAMLVVAWLVADRLTIMALGRDTSVGLGINHARMLQLGLVIVAVISALCTVIVGGIPFVGLVVPNIVSRLAGDNLRGTMPIVAMLGSILVLGCDILGRTINFPYEVPVGTVLGCIGALIFLFLLLYRPKHG